MEPLSIVVVYHPNCRASTDFLIAVSKLNADTEYINIKDDKIDTDLVIDVVPLMIINNDEKNVFKGENAFKKVAELRSLESSKENILNKQVSAYSKSVQFIEPEKKKTDNN
jgi:hypothetical protein